MRRYNVYETITLIRSRPAMYLGECSIIRLQAFLMMLLMSPVNLALQTLNGRISRDFHD